MPEPPGSSCAVSATVTLRLFQPAALGAGDSVATVVGGVWPAAGIRVDSTIRPPTEIPNSPYTEAEFERNGPIETVGRGMLAANNGPGIVSGVQVAPQTDPCRSPLNSPNCTDARTALSSDPAGEAMSKMWP